MHVTAKDKATGKENQITIKANSGLSEEEIQKMVKDAEIHAEEDKRVQELANARNHADSMIHMARKSLSDYGDKIDSSDKAKVEEAIKALEDAARGNDKDEITQKTEALMQASQKIGEQIYKATQQAQSSATDDSAQSQQSSPNNSGDDNVVDAEFTEVNDKK